MRFLAEANVENKNTQILLESLVRVFKFLPHENRRKLQQYAGRESAMLKSQASAESETVLVRLDGQFKTYAFQVKHALKFWRLFSLRGAHRPLVQKWCLETIVRPVVIHQPLGCV